MMNCYRKERLRQLGGLMAVLLALQPLAAGAEGIPELLEPVGAELNTVQARTGEISSISVYDASVVPYVEELSFTQEGVVEAVHVTVGQQVKAGDVLITLNQETQSDRIEELRVAIADVETNGAYEDRMAEIDLAMLEVELQALQKQQPRDEQAIALKQLDVEARRLEQDLALELRALELKSLKEELALLEAEVQEAVLYAPFDGRVMFLSQLEKGSHVQGYDPLIYLADDTRLSVESAYISGIGAAGVHAVYALVKAGRYDVKQIPLDPTEYISQVLAGETVMMQFEILQPDSNLAAGDYAALCVESKYVEQALLIPSNTLYSDSSGRYVYVLEDGERVRRNITLGVTTDWDLQVLEGLEEGAVVCVKE